MNALDAALRGQAQAQAVVQAAKTSEVDAGGVQSAPHAPGAPDLESKEAVALVDHAQVATENIVNDAAGETSQNDAHSAAKGDGTGGAKGDAGSDGMAGAVSEPKLAADASAEPLAKPVPPRKPVVAVRGDDRPGMRKSEPAPPGRGGKFGDRKEGPRGDRPDRSSARPDARGGAAGGGRDGGREGGRDGAGHGASYGARDGARDFGRSDAPRLGDTAFRAQRDALENAQYALKKLAAQAHGETIVQLLTAWETRDAAQLPTVQAMGGKATPATRTAWVQALGNAPAAATPKNDPAVALLRLEMAAELPTPAEHLSARRMLQLQLLTKRNDPEPAQTWGQDAATVLASGFAADSARRIQNVLKVLLKS